MNSSAVAEELIAYPTTEQIRFTICLPLALTAEFTRLILLAINAFRLANTFFNLRERLAADEVAVAFGEVLAALTDALVLQKSRLRLFLLLINV